MSHFAVMVIGADVEKQLQPFHEFECTGFNDEHVQDMDITDEVRAHMQGDEPMSLNDALDYHGLAESVVGDESEVVKAGDDAPHQYGYAIVKDGQLVKAVNRTNPNKKWDWWRVGGRWGGSLKLKDGTKSDSAIKANIDFEGMRDEAGSEAAAARDKAEAALVAGGLAEKTTWESWGHVRDVLNKGDIEAARTFYHEQPAVQAVRKVFDNPFYSVDQHLIPRDQYIQQARDGAAVFYAMVKDSKWIAKGEMGWFGMSDDKVSQEDWNREVNKMLDELPDDTLITVVDCHI